MMIDALVMTLGFEPGPLISTIASAASEGFSERAQILRLTSAFPDEGADRAWLELQRIVNMMDFAKRLGLQPELREVPLTDFPEAVGSIRESLLPLRDKAVKISITGGMRALGLALFTAYLLIDWVREPRLNVYLEGRGIAVEIPPLHRFLTVNLTETQLEILSLMRTGAPYTTSDIAGLLKKDRSTIYKNLQWLCEKGLVERKGNIFRLSKLGSVLSRSAVSDSVEL